MVVTKMSNKKKQRYISVPSQIINSISSNSIKHLLLSLKNKSTSSSLSSTLTLLIKNPRFWILLLVLFGFLGMSKMYFNFDHLLPFSPNPCGILQEKALTSNDYESSQQKSNGAMSVKVDKELVKDNGVVDNAYENHEFWKQPNGKGYRPCLNFSDEYKRDSEHIIKNRTNYLMVVASGGLCQQRFQIVDGVVIARILGAVLVVPILQVNIIWGDESEFSDIFDLDHFKKVLENDVKVVSQVPSTYLEARLVVERETPLNATPEWIRTHYLKRFGAEGILALRGLDSRLTKNLPPDLQKLRCKVSFEALRFAPRIVELGNKLTERMRSKGPYLALHLRMEMDVWVRTGCLPGISPEYDEMVIEARKTRPDLLTSRSNMTYIQRKLAGLCPLNAIDTKKLLKALGAPSSARIYWAGGHPLGGKDFLQPLIQEFPHFYSKEDLALPGELEPFADKASSLAAIDFIICQNSDVFMPSHGGNMGRSIQGHRAYAGHKKSIYPKKRHLPPYFLNSSLPEEEFNRIVMALHRDSFGQPRVKRGKGGTDVLRFGNRVSGKKHLLNHLKLLHFVSERKIRLLKMLGSPDTISGAIMRA